MGEFPVDVVRSAKRKKTVQAALRDGRIKVMVPAGLDSQVESRLVAEMTEKVVRRHTSHGVDLMARAETLSVEYSLPVPSSIEWSGRQMMRWGSCTPTDGAIRISTRLASMPEWVLDSVIVHELAHLEEADHGPRFEELVARYALTERARGYLIAVDQGISSASGEQTGQYLAE